MAAAPEQLAAPGFNWREPNYAAVFAERVRRLERLRGNPALLPALQAHYAKEPAAFLGDWGCVSEPRNVERGLPATVPFVLWPRQREWLDWVVERWRAGEPSLTEKARDSGASWLAIGLSCTLCLFHQGLVIGFGSRKAEYVDLAGSPKALFEKARFFLQHLPPEFLNGWNRDQHSPHMRILFPGTASAMTGESGDGIGRGDRTSIYFVDEAAFLERPKLIDASLAATTNCRQDISTPNGRANPFAEKRHGGKVKVFTFSWRDDPRKDESWYRRQLDELDSVTVAQEIDINYSASVEGVLIPSHWVQAAIDAHTKLGIEPTGMRHGGLDIADEGIDKCAFAGRHGILLKFLQSWSGKGGDIYKSVTRAFNLCDEHEFPSFHYDADGMGAGVRGDAEQINKQRKDAGKPYILNEPFWGSGAVADPDGEMVKKRKNKDFFLNLKAQAWWHLRILFQNTWRAVSEGMQVDTEKIISLDPNLPELTQLVVELSQPTYSINATGKVVVDKAPDGTRSPNLADAAMICFCPGKSALQIWLKLAS